MSTQDDSTFLKAPAAVIEFKVDWTTRGWLATGETITDSSWAVSPSGLTAANPTNDDTTATVWLSGGTLGTEYGVTNTITTNQGRTDQRTLTIQVVNR